MAVGELDDGEGAEFLVGVGEAGDFVVGGRGGGGHFDFLEKRGWIGGGWVLSGGKVIIGGEKRVWIGGR